MDQPVHWYKSQRFIVLCQSSVLTILTWAGVAISTGDTAWRPTAATLLANIVLQLKDWWNPNVVAPFAALNKNNTVTVPASSVRDAEKKSGA